MAKMKTYAVEVEVVMRRTIFVDARRPGGVSEKLLTEDGWREANRYEENDEVALAPLQNVRVVHVREMES